MRRGIVTAGLLALLLMFGRPGWAQQEPPPAEPIPAPASVAHVVDGHGLRDRLGLGPEYDGVRGVESARIAILDYGFEGVATPGRRYLPGSAVLVEHYDPEFIRRNDLGDPEYRKAFEAGNRHGRDMAQIVWAVTGSHPSGPKFFLLNANGPTMLRRAVRYAAEQGVQVLLFSGSFEGGGNGDGRGPVDRAVDEAAARGMIWINAAGNNGGRVLNRPVRILPEGYLKLRDSGDIAAARFKNRIDENAVTITLTWNDYKAVEDAGTDKDLDLIVEDWTGRVIARGDKLQVNASREPGPDESRNPRERVVLPDLAASPVVPKDPEYGYRIRIRAKPGAFLATDRVRLLVTTARETYIPPGSLVPEETVTFLDASNSGELYPPADNATVLTVGDGSSGSSIGPTTDGRIKPDVIVEDSRVDFTDGLVTAGSSNAAAMLAGAACYLKALEPGLKPLDLLRLAHQCAPATTRPAGSRPVTAARAALRVFKAPTRAKLAEVARGRR